MQRNTLFFENVNARPPDDRLDLFEAEYGSLLGRALWYEREGGPGCEFVLDGWDENQALEIIAVASGWLYGERFYSPLISLGDDLDLDDFQYFKPRPSLAVEWRSIDEGDTTTPITEE
jgi:hypothetical protein